MRKLYAYGSLAALVAAAACATAPGSTFIPPGGSSSGGTSGGSSTSVSFSSQGSLDPSQMDGATGPDADDSGLVLVDGAVVGTCVVGRGSCDTTCDLLVENGQHAYIEPKPDDGSALPTQSVDALNTLFASPSTTGGPCVVDPPPGSIFPHNWLRPRIFVQSTLAASTKPIFQIRIHADRQMNDLVVYTRSPSWEIPADVWKALADTTWGEDITVTVSQSTGTGAVTSSQTKFQIAPADANGSMIYWAAIGDSNGFSWLEGFRVGDEGVSKVLTSPTGSYSAAATNVQWTLSRDPGGNLQTMNQDTQAKLAAAGDNQCIGCHVAVPDQNSLAFLDFFPWDGVAANVNGGGTTPVGAMPPWMTPGGAETLSQGGLGMMSFASGTWNDTQHLVVAATQVAADATQITWNAIAGDTNKSNLIWIDLSTAQPQVFVTAGTTTPLPQAASLNGGAALFEANQGKSYGFIQRTGDTNSASTPAWSHDGKRIVYASNNAPKSGRLDIGASDLYVVPFDVTTKQGGAATPLQGASSKTVNEYYPAFSADDKYVAFNSAPPAASMYYNPSAELYIVPSTGGTATRLAANDPPSCMTRLDTKMASTSPGINNSWARWSPEFPTCGGKTYYWLIFSSARLGLSWVNNATAKNFKKGTAPNEPTSQLYLTAVVDNGSGTPQTFPATSIWNQPLTSGTYSQSNHTPAWEVIEIQPPPPTPPPPPPPPPR
jgi:WD40-like Beta Propeller Repeat